MLKVAPLSLPLGYYSWFLLNMAHRAAPYNRVAPVKSSFWFGMETQTHPLKGNDGANADVGMLGPRSLAVFDGVSGVADEGLNPAGLPTQLAVILPEVSNIFLGTLRMVLSYWSRN